MVSHMRNNRSDYKWRMVCNYSTWQDNRKTGRKYRIQIVWEKKNFGCNL